MLTNGDRGRLAEIGTLSLRQLCGANSWDQTFTKYSTIPRWQSFPWAISRRVVVFINVVTTTSMRLEVISTT